MLKLEAMAISPGLAKGKLLVIGDNLKAPPKTTISDAASECVRTFNAIERAKTELSTLYESTLESIGEDAAAIFEVHCMMMEDEDFTDSIRGIIETELLSAEYAVHSTGEQFAAMFEATGSEVMRGRATDVRDLAQRIICILRGVNTSDSLSAENEPVVVAAEELLPSQTVQMDKSLVLAFVCKRGSISSHAAILARTLGIPAVSNLGDGFACLKNGDEVIVDGNDGLVILMPDQEAVEQHERKSQSLAEKEDQLKKLRGLPAETTDGKRVKLYANIGHPNEVEAALSHDAQGVGLFRSEFLYFDGDDFPCEEVQLEAYKTVLEAFAPRRVVVRTLDIGADKQAPYFALHEEENPALGYRAIRICLDRPDIFEPQMRALLRASVYGKLAVMFPMVTGVSEVRDIFNFAESIKQKLDCEGIKYAKDIEFGIMIETPAAVAVAPELASMVDFFSVGTNDLTQYVMAADRMNSKVDYLFDPANPAVLRMIKQATRAAHDAGIWIGICGESATDLRLLPCYIAMGIDELSMNPNSILRVKQTIRGLSAADCENAYEKLLQA